MHTVLFITPNTPKKKKKPKNMELSLKRTLGEAIKEV